MLASPESSTHLSIDQHIPVTVASLISVAILSCAYREGQTQVGRKEVGQAGHLRIHRIFSVVDDSLNSHVRVAVLFPLYKAEGTLGDIKLHGHK